MRILGILGIRQLGLAEEAAIPPHVGEVEHDANSAVVDGLGPGPVSEPNVADGPEIKENEKVGETGLNTKLKLQF